MARDSAPRIGHYTYSIGYVCQGRKFRSDHPFFMQRSKQVDLASGITASYQTGVDQEDEDDYFGVDDEIEGSVDGDSCKGEENEVVVKEEQDEDVKEIQVEKGMKVEVYEVTDSLKCNYLQDNDQQLHLGLRQYYYWWSKWSGRNPSQLYGLPMP